MKQRTLAAAAMDRASRSGVLSETASFADTPRSIYSSCNLQHLQSQRFALLSEYISP